MRYVSALILFLFTSLTLLGANQRILPHVVVGGGYETTVTITNLTPDAGQYTYIQFYDEAGAKWKVASELGSSSRFNFETGPRESVTVVFDSADKSVQSGWAMVVGEGPLLVAADYRFTDDFLPISKAAVLAARPDLHTIVPVAINLPAEMNTGLALVNPSAMPADATLHLFDGQGQSVSVKTVPIPNNGKFVAFLTDEALFPGLQELDGYLQVESMQPLAVMAMKLEHHLFTSLPAVRNEVPWRNANTVFVSPLVGSDLLGDGSLAKPFRTIGKAQNVAAEGGSIYLLPGLYSEASGEVFPVNLAYCIPLRGEDPASVIIAGNGAYADEQIQTAIVGEHKGMLADVTVMNPEGMGIYAKATLTITGCRILNCGGTGIEIAGGACLLMDNLVTQNGIGVHIAPDVSVDLGGGVRYSNGGNQFLGNLQCDVWIEYGPGGCPGCSRSLRFNNWDSAAPEMGTVCSGGMDIVRPADVLIRY